MDMMTQEIWPILSLSLYVSVTAVVISCILGIPMGACIGFGKMPGRSILKALVFAGMATPPVVVGLVLYLLLSRSGLFGSLQWLFTAKAMILAQVILDLPFVIGITMTAVETLPEELRFQLQSLGATPWQIRWTLLCESRHSLVLAGITALGRSMSEVGAVLMIGGNIEHHTRMMTTAILLETNRGRFGIALSLAAVLMTLALIINLMLIRLQIRHSR
ncbi:MAG: ABC transporter permease [Planctomyces sp.]|nr:ABC transporter permease [Planctomyces sp.]